MNVILVRHGQTVANRSGLLQGHIDNPLTDLGRRQADAVAQALRNTDVARIVTSPLVRARETANAIGATLGLEASVEPRLIELDYGDWDGHPLASVPASVWKHWRSDPHFAPPQGESLRAVSLRVAGWLDECATAGDASMIAVSHVSPIKAGVAWALGCDETVTWRMRLDVASITRISLVDGKGSLGSFNETPSLGR